MKHCQVVLNFLLASDEQPSETIQPRVRSFHNPATCSVAWDPYLVLLFFTTGANVRRVSVLRQQLVDFGKVVSFVQAHVLRFFFRRLWSLHGYALQRRASQFHVVPIRTLDRHTHWNPVRLCEQAPFGARFAAVGGIRTGSFFPPTALWSSHRPSPATPSPTLSLHRTRGVQLATSVRTRLHPAILESGRERYWMHPATEVMPATGILCAEHRKWPSLPSDRPSGDDRISSSALGAAANTRYVPKARRISDTRELHPGLGQPYRPHIGTGAMLPSIPSSPFFG